MSRRRKMLTMESKTRTLAIKCYDEQLPEGGWELVVELISQCPKNEVQVIGILHNRGYQHDNIWRPSVIQPHYHIIMRIVGNTSPKRVRAWLNMLQISYREEEDATLWKNHGVETVHDFAEYAKYLTHESEASIEDGEEDYAINELVSNLSEAEIIQIREGCKKVAVVKKVKEEDMINLDKQAYELGYNLGDFNGWYDSLDFLIRSHAKMRTVKESYYRGVEARVNKNAELNRLCVFVQGNGNIGKTFAAKAALKGKKVLCVGGGGTGKFDKLLPSHDAIIVDDDRVPNLLNMTDNYMCQAYKRNKDNPYWCGEFFVVTSNLPFEEWVESCGLKVERYDERKHDYVFTDQFLALETRFFICHIEPGNDGKNHLFCDWASKRGLESDQKERKERFKEFASKYEASISSYVPNGTEVDYSDVLGCRFGHNQEQNVSESECQEPEFE